MNRFTSSLVLVALASSSMLLTVPLHAAKGKDKAAEKSDPPAEDKKADKTDEKKADDEKASEDKTDAADAKSDAEPAAGKEEKPSVAAEAAAGDTSVVEEPGKTYQFVGLRYRGIVVPKFMINLFGQGGRTIY